MGKYTKHIHLQRGCFHKASLFKRRVICKEKECNRYELLTMECLEIHKLVYHRDQQFRDEYRPIEHSYRKEKRKLKCKTLIETNIFGDFTYGNEYQNVESFQNKMFLTEIEIQESQGKRKWNTVSTREEQRKHKLKITSKNF